MGAEVHDFEAGDNGQNAGMGYPGPMPYSNVGSNGLFQILWRGRWLILLSLTLAVAGAYLYLRQATPLYESVAQILVDKPNAQPRSDVPQPVGSTLTNYLATQASIITSPEIVAVALRDPNVLALPTFSDPSYVQGLIGTLSAEASKKADIIQIRASSAHPEDAAHMVNALVRAYVRWHEANRQLSTADLLKDLNRQLEQRMTELNRKRQTRVLFEQRNPQVVERTRSGPFSRKLELVKEDLVVAQLNRMQQDASYERLVGLASEPNQFRQYVYGQLASLISATDDGERSHVAESLSKTRQQLEELSAIGTAQRSQLTLLQDREKQLKERMTTLDKEFMQRCLTVAQAVKEDAGTREQLLTKMYEAELEKVQSVTLQDSEYAFILSECQTLENLYNSLLAQINSLDLNAQLEGLNVHVMAKAVPATVPFSPQPGRIVGMGLLLGLMAGAGLSLLRDWRDQRVRSADEVVALVGAPILGSIPSLPKRTMRRGRRNLLFVSDAHALEACRAIRTALLYGAQRGQTRTILVTSPGSAEGKTVLVSNLGMALARAGQKTLIVDADLRKPVEQRVLTTNGHRRGLVDVLDGQADLQEVIRPTDIDGLYLLGGGQSTTTPSELLNSPAFAALLERLRGEYDRVLVDSPPVGMVTDAQILATLCGSTLLVLRAEKSSRILTQRARDALLAVGVRVAGAVVNDVPRRAGRYSRYSGYDYYYSSQGSDGHNGTREEVSVTAAVHPHSEALCPKTVEPNGGAVQGESSVHAGPPIEIRAVAPKRTGLPAADAPGSKDEAPLATQGQSQATGEKALMAADPPSQGQVLPAAKAGGPTPTSEGPLAGANPEVLHGGVAGGKKKNGRKVANGLASNPGAQPPANGETPKKDNGRRVRKKPPTDAADHPEQEGTR